MTTEYYYHQMEITETVGYPEEDSAEHEGPKGACSVTAREAEEMAGTGLMERILDRDNLNRAFKKVKANKGAPGIDKMSIDEAQDWLREHKTELIESIMDGTYKPQPVRRKEIPKEGGKVRKLGIPTVIDRVIQQAVTQQLTPIFEPIFAEGSYGYRPNRGAQQAIKKVVEYANEGYTRVASIDLSKYFDTLNHDLLLNMVREQVKDERVIQLIKKFLKAGVMENGVIMPTEEGSPQGGNISPLLANIYLNKFDQLMIERGVKEIRYADDIILLAKTPRAAQRIMDNARDFLEGKLKLTMNADKSRVVSVYSATEFKYLGFAIGKDRNGAYVRVHPKSLKKAKDKLRELTKRNQGRNVRDVMAKMRLYITGWLGYYGIARIKRTMEEWDGWLRRRFRCYIWKQWKTISKRERSLRKLGMNKEKAHMNACTRKGYWAIAGSPVTTTTITNQRLEKAGYPSLLKHYQLRHERALLSN